MGAEFARARTAEQRALRRATILTTARDLLVRRRPAEISLGDIARAAGMAKSNVLRYFDSREAIFLTILLEEYAAWVEECEKDLDATTAARPAGGPETAGRVLARAACRRPVLCDLLGSVGSVLERNVSVAEVAAFKHAVTTQISRLNGCLADALGPWSAEVENLVAHGVHALVHDVWQFGHPAPALASAQKADPEVPRIGGPLEDVMAAALAIWFRGLRAGG